ncbi:MAG: hypothetical protein K0R65_2801 [Crocinitomicaceae bacterium]|jgi:hypothetical protein|nr:hypothetical protein [Crocinitomicaceae bacterium]
MNDACWIEEDNLRSGKMINQIQHLSFPKNGIVFESSDIAI